MSNTPLPVRLLVISGSARHGSHNRQLADLAARKAQALGAETTSVDLAGLDLPIFHANWEERHGVHPGALKLRELFATHDGLLLTCPEYNALPTPLLINSFDWLSTVAASDGLPAGSATTPTKPAGLLSASTGALGGIRALPIVRTFLSTNFAMVVVPEQLGVPMADQAFDDAGDLKSPGLDKVLDKVVASVVQQARWRKAG
ncbi:NADPH-dependent FMN reductase [Aquabacterium sp.]|uniref:NADPH-dependent FMN reductase n=1 Tax=Aquabacterium sp. TaxID=1872578 RepID=UPI003D6C7FA1